MAMSRAIEFCADSGSIALSNFEIGSNHFGEKLEK
jgi:hypothetical protein